MKKLLSILMTLLLVVLSLGSVPTIIYADEMPTFIGPNDSDHAYLDFHSNGENYSFYFMGDFANYEKEDSNDYLLWVNDEQFSNEHLTISCGSGTASYNPTDNILTLTDAQITKGTSVDYLGSGILSRIDNLIINVIGNCSITNTGGEGISTYDQNELYENIPHDINITGAGTLTINENTAYYGYGLYSTGKISVEGTKINIESANSSIWAEDNITIKDSELYLKAIAVSNPYYEMGMGEETIGGYGIVSNNGTIAIDNSSMSVDSEKNSAFLTGTSVDESKISLTKCKLTLGIFSEGAVTIDKLPDTTKPGGNITTSKPSTLKAQKITTAKIKTVKAKKLKKKSFKIKLKAKTDGKGKLTYKVTKYPKGMKKYIKVSKKGVVTLKKKAKKGSYKITITAAAKGNYKKATKTITIKVK